MKIRYIASKIKIAILIVGFLFGGYSVVGFYLLPTLVMSKLPVFVQQETGRKLSFSNCKFDPFSLQFSLQAFKLQEPDGQLFVGFDDLFIDINALQSIHQVGWGIDKIQFNKPVVRIAKHQDGTFNFNDLLKKPTTSNDEKPIPVTIESLLIVEGKLDWQDAHFNSPEKETAFPINLTINHLSTEPGQQANARLSLALNSGGLLDWQGAIGLNPLTSSGHIRLDKVPLPRIKALALQDVMQQELQGYALFEANYQANYTEHKFNIDLKQSKFEIRDLLVSANRDDKALIKLLNIALDGIDFNLENHILAIKAIVANQADIKTAINAEGVFNFQPLLPVAKTNLPLPHKIPWNILIGSIELNNFAVTFEDRMRKKPVWLTAKTIHFKLTDFSNQVGSTLPFQISAGINDAGSIKLDGSLAIEPLSLAMNAEVKDISLESFQSYVDDFLRLDVIDGRLATEGNVTLTKSATDEWGVKFTGNAAIADLLTRDRIKNKDFIKWENLTLTGIDVDSVSNQYSAEALVIDKPYVRVVIRLDKSVNFSDILIRDNKKSPPAPLLQRGEFSQKPLASIRNDEPLQNSLPTLQKGGWGGFQNPTFKLGKIQIIDGSSDFADLSLILPFAAQIKSLDGGASGISSDQKSIIKLGLKGNAYDLAPVDIRGEISPYLGNYNVLLNFTGMPMPLISSYMVQFAGYKVEKGKMSLELDYKVANKELTASNTILIDQFELGEKVDNPKAVSLPLALAVALMKDSDGKIKIHVPISGSLEDPKFSVKHLVVDALVNAITKVISSPFRALASLIGSQEDLSSISFEAGSAALNKAQISKLDDLVKALKTRSALKLEIKGAVFKEQDWPAISDDALYDQLKRIKAAEINKQGGRKIRAEYVVISDQDYRRLMEELFVEKFPLLVEKSLLGTPRLIDSKAGDFYEVAKQKLSAIIIPEQQRLKGLATERAQAIANYMVKTGGIDNERVFILDSAIDPARVGNEIVSVLSLKVD